MKNRACLLWLIDRSHSQSRATGHFSTPLSADKPLAIWPWRCSHIRNQEGKATEKSRKETELAESSRDQEDNRTRICKVKDSRGDLRAVTENHYYNARKMGRTEKMWEMLWESSKFCWSEMSSELRSKS
ncbi:hypothetical protein HPP92_023214 [Vanilla planifolia]|uniref:Uncharacterized protein n=1 Tax=Vanilla planifolia TaxID=51239 RepID=A0A835UGB9_VANPL|nr:hypothetical protein HPP92_023523 [Vanilla planifolia]KAG0460086.1 hypothetical protein HPP92_023214 [Vanilla planifolia]